MKHRRGDLCNDLKDDLKVADAVCCIVKQWFNCVTVEQSKERSYIHSMGGWGLNAFEDSLEEGGLLNNWARKMVWMFWG